MPGDARRLREGIEGVPVFKVYSKYLRIEPRQVGEALFYVGQQLVPVGCYAVPIPPIYYVVRKLAAAL